MAQTQQGSHFTSGSDQQPEQAPRSSAAKATPMVQTGISNRSAQATRRAARHAGQHDRRRRHRTSQRHVPVIAFVVVAFAVMGALGYWLTHTVFDNQDDGPKVEPGIEVNITIPEGAGGAEISEILREAGVISDTAAFFKEVRNQDAEASMKSGSYSFITGANVKEVVRQLVEGPNSTADSFTIPEGYNVNDVARIVEERLGIPADDFLARAKASNYVNDYPFLSEAVDDSLEGFLFPKTYDMGGKEKSADNVIRTMLNQYSTEVGSLDFDAARAALSEKYDVDMSNYKILIMASVIEKEAYSGDDWVNVSSTFYNRLNQWMPLQSDATMGYVTGGPVTPDDLEVESPYNTYLNYGLPPTPICNPSLKSIEAALHPADTKYLYFLIVEENGYSYHAFSETYEQHLEAIAKVDAETA